MAWERGGLATAYDGQVRAFLNLLSVIAPTSSGLMLRGGAISGAGIVSRSIPIDVLPGFNDPAQVQRAFTASLMYNFRTMFGPTTSDGRPLRVKLPTGNYGYARLPYWCHPEWTGTDLAGGLRATIRIGPGPGPRIRGDESYIDNPR